MMSTYIKKLRLKDTPVIKLQRKVVYLGFLICIESVKSLYKTYVKEKNLLKFILTYKLSQDHLELFFGSIRSRGGFNNNPTARQFEAAYKRLLVHAEIAPGNRGNAIILEKVPILAATKPITQNENGENLETSKEYQELQEKIKKDIINQNYIGSTAWNLTIYTQDIVSYISGFVVKALRSSVTCLKCQELLVSQTVSSQLQKRKTYGKLNIASPLIISICQNAEKFFRFFNKTTGIYSTAAKTKLIETLISNAIKNLPVYIFECFGDHLFEEDPLEGHCMTLVKSILRHYFNIRIHYEISKKLDLNKKNRIRSVNTKLILFKNQ